MLKRKMILGIFNERILKNKFFLLIILVILSASHPIYSWNKSLFFIMLGLILYFIGIFVNFLFGSTQRKLLSTLFFFVWIRMLLFLLATIVILTGMVNIVNYNEDVALIFIWLIPLICLGGILEFLFIMILRIRGLEETGGQANRISALIMAFLALVSALALPDIAFGYGYKVFFDVLYSIDLTLNWHYLSFVISNTLPVQNDDLLSYIENINTNPALRYYQIFHVYMNRIMELLIIALILNNLFSIIQFNKNFSKK